VEFPLTGVITAKVRSSVTAEFLRYGGV